MLQFLLIEPINHIPEVLNNPFVIPSEGWTGLQENWKSDLIAAFIVFTYSLPYCLSIALACNFPLLAGFVSAVIGGLVVSFVSGSYLTIKSPSLSLAPPLFVAIHTLGSGYVETGYKYTLAVILVAGIVQVLIGAFRMGELLNTIPEAIVYGLLATLGIDIILYQSHYLIGLTPTHHDIFSLIKGLPGQLKNVSSDIATIGLLSLALMAIFSSIKYRLASALPAPILVLLFGIIMSFSLKVPALENGQYLVSFSESWQTFFVLPDFSKIQIWQSIELVLIIVLVSSLETIVNVKAIDALDFYRRRSRISRELVAVGAGNTLCGLLGGVPLISSFSLSSTNINQRAKTRWSNFMNGFLTLGAALTLLPWLERVPLATLAALTIYLAYSFVSPKLLKDLRYVGKEQLMVFLITLFSALFGGLFVGLLLGYLSYLCFFIWMDRSLSSLFKMKVKIVNYSDQRSKVMVRGNALASNYLHLKKQIDQIPPGCQIYLDFTKSKIVDHSFIELIYHHPYNFNNTEGSIELQGLEDHKLLSKHPLATRLLTRQKSRIAAPTPRLNERQLEVLAIASVNNSKLLPNIAYDGNKLRGFHFALGFDIKYRENKFFKNINSTKYTKKTKIEFSDIYLSRGLRMREQSLNMSVLLISNLQIYVPAFMLNKEGLLSKVKQNIGYEDINFDKYPVFSNTYLLEGLRENEIRTFFKDQLIEFFESNTDFNIESQNNLILIYKDMRLMNQNEIADAIVFAENFLKLIYQEYSEKSLMNVQLN
ncbi:MAG: SulP family inorganic anion transporter [Bacteroidota bacterium]